MSLTEFGYQPMPWANGGGTTWEIARRPADPAAEFIWRVSIAEIDGVGPFSALPGVDRIFTLVSAAPIDLDVNGCGRQARFATPVCFSGEDAVACNTAAPAMALNVMTRRGRASARVELLRSDRARQLDAADDEAMLLIPLTGTPGLRDSDGLRPLQPLQAATVGHAPVALAGTCLAAVIRLAEITAK